MSAASLLLLHYVAGVWALVELRAAVLDIEGLICNSIKEESVVRDEDDGLLRVVGREVILKPQHCVRVEVVRRQLRIVNGMIAMTKDGWKTSDVAIGYFNSSSETSDKLGGVNAQLLAGKLIVGNNLVIENNDADGSVTQFKVDGSGAWLSNSRFVLQSNKTNDKGELVGGKIMIDPEYGILAGGTNLFTVNGTSITPSFMNEDGEMVVDDDGMPTNSNFYLDIDTGNAYFRGTVMATKGSIGGWEIEDNQLTSGSGKTYVALNSSSSEDSLYAMWAGDDSP